jgi:hypothetical protein
MNAVSLVGRLSRDPLVHFEGSGQHTTTASLEVQEPGRDGASFTLYVGCVAWGKAYEMTIERGLYKAIHELQCLQAARAGVPVPPRAAADVDVHVTVQGSSEDLW